MPHPTVMSSTQRGVASPSPARRRALVHRLAGSLFVLGLGAALFFAYVPVAHSTSVVWLDDDALIDHAERIVHGEVVSATSHWDPISQRVYTRYVFRPFEVLKGSAGSGGLVTFREWGGEIDGVRCWIPGAGRFKVGDEVLAFLGAPDPMTGVGFTTGLAQGKFTVERRGQQARAVRSLGALTTLEPDGLTPHPHVQSDARPLEPWLCRIRERCGR